MLTSAATVAPSQVNWQSARNLALQLASGLPRSHHLCLLCGLCLLNATKRINCTGQLLVEDRLSDWRPVISPAARFNARQASPRLAVSNTESLVALHGGVTPPAATNSPPGVTSPATLLCLNHRAPPLHTHHPILQWARRATITVDGRGSLLPPLAAGRREHRLPPVHCPQLCLQLR